MSYKTEAEPVSLDALIEENHLALSQLSSFVGGLATEHFRQTLGNHGHHTVGKHVRHIIDHYDALQVGIEASVVIDYEQRLRDPALEDWPGLACRRLDAIQKTLSQISESHPWGRTQLTYDTGHDRLHLESSLGRELTFLTSHTIHHMAIIGLLAEQMGLPLPESFGVHPSTLRHWQRLPAEQVPLSRRSA
jgi:uncharacterized damage-inducible protein DinB